MSRIRNVFNPFFQSFVRAGGPEPLERYGASLATQRIARFNKSIVRDTIWLNQWEKKIEEDEILERRTHWNNLV